MLSKKRKQTKIRWALAVLTLLLAPYLFGSVACFAQTEPVPDNQSQSGDGAYDALLSGGARETDETVPDSPYADADQEVPQVINEGHENDDTVNEKVTLLLGGKPTTMAQELVEQGRDPFLNEFPEFLGNGTGAYNETYLGLKKWFSDDIVSNLFVNFWQLIGKWISEFIDGWIADTVQFLTAFLRFFVLNPNIPLNASTGQQANGQTDDISPFIAQAADVMYGIAVDLLLLLFILCIWKYWADAAWRGGSNLMGAVGRLIFTAGLLLAWPTIYAFEVQISNEMIKAIYFNSADQVVMLDSAMAAAVKGGLVATVGGLAHAFAPVVGSVAGGALGGGAGGLVLGTVGEIVSFAGLIIYLILGAVLITQLVYLLILKAIQTGLLVAQYMFAPVFLVFFATPDTESVTSGYVRSFVEVSLWSFFWVGLLKILVIVLYSDFNPWGKILMAVAILQLMIQVPSFLARAQISPMSDFISAGFVHGLGKDGFMALGGFMKNRAGQAFDYMFNQQYAARGIEQSKSAELNNLPQNSSNSPQLQRMRDAAAGRPVDGRGGPDTPTPPPLKTNESQKTETEEEKRKREEAERLARLQQQQQQHNMKREGATDKTTPPPTTTTPQTNQLQTPASKQPPGATNVTPGSDTSAAQTKVASTVSNPERGNADPTLGTPAQNLASQAQEQLNTVEQLQAAADEKIKGNVAKPPSSIINAAEKNNHAMYRTVPEKIAAEAAMKYAGNSIAFSEDGTNKILGDGGGNLRHMRARRGATPEEVAHMVMAAGLSSLFSSDSVAFDAARQAAIDAGEDEPQGMVERMGAGFLAHQGRSFKQTSRAKQRFQQSMFKHAALGAESYVTGNPGNAYTDYLRNRFGERTDAHDVMSTFILTDEGSPESPWNWAYAPASNSLLQAGLPINPANRAAAANPYVMKLPGWQKVNAIPAIANIATEMAQREYPHLDPSKPDDQMVLAAAVGRIAPAMSNAIVESALAVQIESGGANVSMDTVESTARLVSAAQISGQRMDAGTAYHALHTAGSLIQNGIGAATGTRRVQRAVSASLISGGGPGGGGYHSAVSPAQVEQEIARQAPAGQGTTTEDVWVEINRQQGPDQQGPTSVENMVIQTPDQGGQPGRADLGNVFVSRDNSPTGGTGQRSERIIDATIHQQGSDQPVEGSNVHIDPASLTDGPAGPPEQDVIIQARTSQTGYSGQGQPPQQTIDIVESAPGGGGSGGGSGHLGDLHIPADMPAGNLNDHKIRGQAEMLVMNMLSHGFRGDQVSDPKVMALANHFQNNQPQMMPTVAVAARVMGPGRADVQSVETIHAMVDAGWSPYQIQRPDVETAKDIINVSGYPTPQTVRRYRLDENYLPGHGIRNILPSRNPQQPGNS